MKILLTIILLVSTLFGVDSNTTETNIKSYFTNVIKYNREIALINIDILGSRDLVGIKDFKVYFIKFKLKNKKTGKIFDAPEKVFSNGTFLTTSLIDLKTKDDLRMSTYPELPSSIYNEEHLISGEANATNKIVVFSDPRCPSCRIVMPELLNFAEQNREKVALYYYHFPLTNIHPKAEFISKMMIADINKNKNKNKNIIKKVYLADFDLSPNLKVELLKMYNKEVGSDLNITDITTFKANEELKNDIKIGNDIAIAGTPTIFLNGNFTRDYKKLK